ncbi:unnamed protein product, partial [Prorocentrum cordatum]
PLSTSEWRRDPSGNWRWIGQSPAAGRSTAAKQWAGHLRDASHVGGGGWLSRRTAPARPSGCSAAGFGPADRGWAAELGSCAAAGHHGQPLEASRAAAAGWSGQPATAAAYQAAAPAAGDTSQPAKARGLARVKYLEAALAALPADDPLFAEEKVGLGQRFAEAKRAVHSVRPIGARIDCARAALERSRSRQAEAAKAVEAAQKLPQLAADEVAALEAELQELRQAEREATDVSSAEMEPAPPATPSDQARAALNMTIANLATDSCVHPGRVEAAHAHVKQLFDGFRLALQQAEATRAAAAGTATHPAERRHVVKSPPVAPMPAQAGALVRHRGKQPRKELITDWFTRKKVIRTIGKEAAAGVQVSCQLMLGKVQILEQSFFAEDLDIVFIQEGRARAAEVRRGLRYTTLFWVAGLAREGIPLIWVGAHAPRERADLCEREMLWDTLVKHVLALKSLTPSAKIFLGIGANGRVGARSSGVTGSREADAFTANGAAFAAALHALRVAALDVFFDVGCAWRSGKGHTSRIDYICGPLDDVSRVASVSVPSNVQLSLASWEDRGMVMAVTSVSERAPIDDRMTAFNQQVRDAAMRACVPPADQPRQPWITPDAWRVLRVLAPSRRVVHAARAAARTVHPHMVFRCWAALRPAPFRPLADAQPRLGWHAQCVLPQLSRLSKLWHGTNASSSPAWCAISSISVASCIRRARPPMGQGAAAGAAAHPVLLRSRFLSCSEAERQARWLEHFRDVFHGAVLSAAQLQALPPCRAPGGGPPLHELLAVLYQDVVGHERWPSQGTGGRMQSVHERRGPLEDCDESRGIVLEDHAAKALKQMLGDMLNEPCHQNMPEAQHGAVAGKGTDYAAHLVHCFVAYCAARHLSCFVWFFDLVKAFDRLASTILSCKFGSMVFNSTFSLAMVLIRDALLEHGVVLRLRPANAAFWADRDEAESGVSVEPDGVPVVDATFVGDECFLLLGRSAADLDKAIETMIQTVCEMYGRLNFTITWKAGKSECFLVYWGPSATKCLQRRRVLANGGLAVAVRALDVMLHVVTQYRHLGSHAYGPIACKVFGSCVIERDMKFRFMQSLILSRLLYNAHVVVPTRRFLIVLNGVYMS